MTVGVWTRRAGLLVVAAAILTLAAAARQAFRGKRWYSLVYRAFYLARLRIWERQVPPSDLIELIEGPLALAPGPALDLGCGTGTDSIYLAAHGWDVTGVDMVPAALAIARSNAPAKGVRANFVHGDVTRLRDVVQGRFDLVLDFGCFHTAEQATLRQRLVLVLSIPYACAAGANHFGELTQRSAEVIAERVGRTTDDFAVRALLGAVPGVPGPAAQAG